MRGRAGQAPGPAAELLTWTSLPESEPECIQLEVASSWLAAADLDATRRFGLLRSWVRVGLEVGRGHGRLPPRPQPRPGPGLKFRLSRSLSRRLDRIRLLGRELERWPGPGDWPGFK